MTNPDFEHIKPVVSVARHRNVAVLSVDNPPINALSDTVRAGLCSALREAEADPAVRAVVLACEGNTFVAGADIREFARAKGAAEAIDVPAVIESCRKPVVAALHGQALGGGLELALACHGRVALAGCRLGLPEITLGLIPGGGGTQRLPRLIGLEAAAELILSGATIDAETARESGLLDAVWPDRLRERAIEFAASLADSPAGVRRASTLAHPPMSPQTGQDLRKIAESRPAALRAPQAGAAAVEALSAAAQPDFARGRALERELFARLRDGEESRALRALFFAERSARRVGLDDATSAPPMAHDAAVVGAGTMGRGIAIALADAGLRVRFIDVEQASLDRALEAIRAHYRSLAARGRMTEAAARDAVARISPASDMQAAAEADVVVEAAFEDLAIKQAIFRQLDSIVRPGAVLATNTSTLDVDAIAAATRRPQDVVGTHFFSPANVMRLLEVVRGARTAPRTLGAVLALGRRMGKVCVTVGVCDGFVANRMSAHRARQIELLLQHGALPQDIDQAAREFGFSMGPCAATDLAGLDISWRIRRGKGARSPIADALCELGRFGQKVGRGYFSYAPGSRVAVPDPEVEALIRRMAEQLGIRRQSFDLATITDRLILPVINEGARVLQDGVARQARDIDLIWVHGFGWPARRGGPMFHAERVGLASVCDRLARLADALEDASLQPAPLLRGLATRGAGFASLHAARQA
ncbi:3-hydroxyacyl-CoA dehydrogenase NAD-binding domain-containing protein [Bordetella pertussis]|uniref:3-hydroxyacyl-CoA dehydrogenase NAD-binding domain-containing protein n=1 Tax=Bordetella pertussis TaxID=520 RepID=UPI0018C16836|nr:3-hydroxyacyl-CoA dehydrogenase NAD-binding domain-containing protein [Bordetella pertussis]SQE16354.1 bifunctional enoyl-CoA hydratase/3-hydroxyacyl-CoA dehydrogenase [Bordetella pertussis]